jgi:hypothetical protein
MPDNTSILVLGKTFNAQRGIKVLDVEQWARANLQ